MNDHMGRGILYALATVSMWATLGVSLKLSVTYVDDFTVVVVVGALTVVSFAVYLAFTGRAAESVRELRTHWASFLAAGVIGLGIQQLLYVRAYSLLPASQTIVLFSTYPLVMVLIAVLFHGERVRWDSILLLLAGFGGVAVMVSKGTLAVPSLGPGALSALGASVTWAVFSILLKKRRGDETVAMFWYSVFGLLFLLACAPFHPGLAPISPSAWLGLAYVAVVPTALAFVCWSKAMLHLPTHVSSCLALVTPVFSLLLVVVVLGERLIASQALGLGVVVVSVGLNILSSARRASASAS